jgi:hypothetical protein
VTDDFHRVDIEIDGEEKRIKVSSSDTIRMLQPHWLSDVEKGWQLISDDLERKLPGLISRGIREHAEEEEARKQKIIEEYKAANPQPQLKDQVQDMASGRYGWAIAIFGVGLGILGLSLILNLPIVRNLLGG